MAVEKAGLAEEGIYKFSCSAGGALSFIGGTHNPFSSIVSGNAYILGNILVGTDATSKIECTGDVIAFLGSDRSLKDNIVKIQSPLEKLKHINGYTFDWNEKSPKHKTGKSDIGVIAQEIEKVIPEAVRKDKVTKTLQVEYVKIVPLLIECIKEQQKQIDELRGDK